MEELRQRRTVTMMRRLMADVFGDDDGDEGGGE
jgi:hypothetical protein